MLRNLLFASFLAAAVQGLKPDPDFTMMQQYMDKHGSGFGWDNHVVHTDDGYVLNVFRLIPEEAFGMTESYSFGEPVFI